MIKIILFGCLFVAASAQLPPDAVGQALQTPEQFKSENGFLNVVLTVDVWDVYFGSLNIRRRLFNGRMPGPTMCVRPGDVVTVLLRNNLEPAEDGRNTTNFQVHGLHMAPLQTTEFEPPVNEVLPGESFLYMFTIPPLQQPGSFWYYPDVPVKSDYQLAGGMAGMITVEPLTVIQQLKEFMCPDYCENDIELILQPSMLYRKYPERYDDLNCIRGLGNGDETLARLHNIEYFTVNGQVLPTIDLEWWMGKRIRFVNAGASDVLEIDTPCLENGYCCDVSIIAADGVLFNKPQQPRNGQTLLAPGQRVDWLMSCTKPGVYELNSAPLGENNVSRSGEFCFRGKLATIIVGEKPAGQQPSRLPITFDKREEFIGDLVYIDEGEITGKFVLDANPNLFSNAPRRDENSPAIIDLRRSIIFNGIEEWTILNSDPEEFNTLYMPINHVQIISYNKYNGPINMLIDGKSTLISQDLTQKCQVQYPGYDSLSWDLETHEFPADFPITLGHKKRYKDNMGAIAMADIGEWRDVITIPPLANITIRFVADSIKVKFEMHSTQNKNKTAAVSYLGHIKDRGFVFPPVTDPYQFVVTNMGTCMLGDFYPQEPEPKEVMTPMLTRLAKVFKKMPWYRNYVEQFLDSYFGKSKV